MLSLGANNLPQFDEGNLLCVEFNNLNMKYLSIYSNSLLASQGLIGSEQKISNQLVELKQI